MPQTLFIMAMPFYLYLQRLGVKGRLSKAFSLEYIWEWESEKGKQLYFDEARNKQTMINNRVIPVVDS